MEETTPPDLNPKRMLEPFMPLTRGSYPVFNKYPKFIVDYQVILCPCIIHECIVIFSLLFLIVNGQL